MNRYLDIAPEVKEALDAGKPVVALESTIISHGMPYPQNVETALKVESIIREAGAVPATIAIIGGKNILLSDELMVSFAKIQDGKPIPSLLVDVAFRRLQTPLFVRVPEKALCLAGSRNSFAHISAVRNLYLSIRWHIGCITSGNTVMALPYIFR